MKPALAVFLFSLAGPATAQRLPQTAVPERYRITLAPDFGSNSFAGDETIAVRVLEPTSSITLNALELEFQEATVTAAGERQPATVATDAQREMATLAVSKPLAPGPAEIHIRFTGILNDKLRGFYLSQAHHRKYAVTQFEPTDARRAFPCFDEPAMKATFQISLVVDRGDTAISNGKIVSDAPGPGDSRHTLNFSTTPKMSTYLVAMAVGDFQCREGAADGIPIRICATPDKQQLTGFALKSAERVLDYYNHYYGIKYPFGKLDVLAAPDFEAGAMENTAAIFYRETELLIDDQKASVGAHQLVARILAHEIAHMWFGDLVTMKWWDDIWLNEGFATWMSHKPIAAWKPEWDEPLDQAQSTGAALSADSLNSTHPIRVQVEAPAEINQYADAITYDKTAAVLSMLESYVGEDKFRAGVNAYLEKHAYSNATSEDFWNALDASSQKPVDQIMRRFVDQAGPPLVSLSAQCQGGTTSVTLDQRRYFYGRAAFEAGSSELWQVPVYLKWPDAAQGTPRYVVLKDKQQDFNLPGCAPWVFANADARGYYRSAYTPEALRKIAADAEQQLTPAERITLLNDAWAMVRVGRAGIGDFLSLAEGVQSDRTPAVVLALLGRLDYIGDDLVSGPEREPYRAWVRRLVRPMAQELGWEPAPHESDERRRLRAGVLHALAYTGRDPEALAQARRMAERYMKDSSSVDASLATTVVRLAALEGDAALYDRFLAAARSTPLPEDAYRYLYVLTYFGDRELLKRALDYVLSPDVRSQDAAYVILSVLLNPEGRELGWEFVKARWPEVEKKLTAYSGPYLVRHTGDAFCDAKSRGDLERFFTQHQVVGAERSLQQALETVDDCADLRSLQESNLVSWLKQRSASAGR